MIVSIGGNDIGWSAAVFACLAGTDVECEYAVAETRNTIVNQLPTLLDVVYSQISEAAPDAHVVVTGYPRLFSPEHGDYRAFFQLLQIPVELTVVAQEALNEGADLLNEVIAEAAADHGFQFVDVTSRFTGHGVNAPDPWILDPNDPGSFHPTAKGYQAYTAAVTAAIKPGRLR